MIEDEDEIVIIKLPKSEAKILKNMIKREEVYNWLSNRLRNTWVWVAAGGVLTVLLLWDRLKLFMTGTVE